MWNFSCSDSLHYIHDTPPPTGNIRCPEISAVPLLHLTRISQKSFYIAKNRWYFYQRLSLVIRLGLEPRTPTLKVLCSTCWASESSFFRLRCKGTAFCWIVQIFRQLFFKKIIGDNAHFGIKPYFSTQYKNVQLCTFFMRIGILAVSCRCRCGNTGWM